MAKGQVSSTREVKKVSIAKANVAAPIAPPSQKKLNRMTGKKDGIVGAGIPGGTNKRAFVINLSPTGSGKGHFETKSEEWWAEYYQAFGNVSRVAKKKY